MIFDNYDNVGTEEFLSQTKREMDSMDAALDGLDDEYSEYLLTERRDLDIASGEDLKLAMLAGTAWDDFLDSRK
jgi:hypothetical protein